MPLRVASTDGLGVARVDVAGFPPTTEAAGPQASKFIVWSTSGDQVFEISGREVELGVLEGKAHEEGAVPIATNAEIQVATGLYLSYDKHSLRNFAHQILLEKLCRTCE